ncbi:hypothetical protein CUMW_230410 [Citrus unshiu]|uniref:Leucine-rich repeat-containing N-terminal plant-type domain-containing protein n=1 Tax=Citrus unshiu TaxID=55188 RepID=A0A2H5QHH0_CITUN|nr:hypothetical protein CUMW_230410 [Citrus unshiu]
MDLFISIISFSTDCCLWEGIKCDFEAQVTHLWLPDRGLRGSIYRFTGKLTHLCYLNLSHNHLSILSPSVPFLSILDFFPQLFSGQLTPRKLLQASNISGSYLSGSISNDVSATASLEEIYLPVNQLSGAISNGVVNLTSLNIGKLANLKSLKLHTNILSCFLPQSLMNCTNLITLNLRINNFRGDLSAYNFSTLYNLHTIDLGNNNFTGSFPLTLTSCKFFTVIRLSRNKIEGQISPKILALVSLSYLSITNNNLSNITGAIRILMGCKNLRMLLLCKNFVHEAIPDENQITISSFAFQNLVVLGIGDCEIKGQIPTWLGKLKKLQVLDLGSNQVTGLIPGWLGNMPNLFYIDLSYNSISGEFPKEFCGLPALALQEAKYKANETKCTLYNQQYNKLFSLPPAIYLRNNGLNGSIPIEIGNLNFLHVLDLSLNNFSGEIPDLRHPWIPED